jgi:hypothetical protein
MIVPPYRGVVHRSTSQANSKQSWLRVLKVRPQSEIMTSQLSGPKILSLHFNGEQSVVAPMAISPSRESGLDE